ncbi:cation diffusion facilitator family transporter [Thermoflavimicrobium daqui]|uniref:Transporter n=1 Tax=Thermoflavimicrobium daqui TaxID=2137476 RepID=A0A364K6D1_9BACL|nr:cation diffusion facilitator family transporter [Thermoflavimicrobium daqui]RAL25854.1 transporter [Thermoflavimicrobium daqui]
MESNFKNLNEKAAWLSIGTYIFLSAGKLTVGYLTHSKALTADGLNNTTDIFASIAVLIGLKFSKKPADHDHPYGHRRAESIAALIASFIMMSVAIEVCIGAGKAIFYQQTEKPDWIATWISIICAFIMFIVYRTNLQIARKTNSQAVKAAAKDNLADALVSVGAAIGIAGSQFQLPWLDPATAFLVGGIIAKTAWDIFCEATHLLTDGIEHNLLTKLSKVIAEVHGVRKIKRIKGRLHGAEIWLDVDITVDPQLNVIDSHQITEEIEKELQSRYEMVHVQIHVEPDEHINESKD